MERAKPNTRLTWSIETIGYPYVRCTPQKIRRMPRSLDQDLGSEMPRRRQQRGGGWRQSRWQRPIERMTKIEPMYYTGTWFSLTRESRKSNNSNRTVIAWNKVVIKLGFTRKYFNTENLLHHYRTSVYLYTRTSGWKRERENKNYIHTYMYNRESMSNRFQWRSKYYVSHNNGSCLVPDPSSVDSMNVYEDVYYAWMYG